MYIHLSSRKKCSHISASIYCCSFFANQFTNQLFSLSWWQCNAFLHSSRNWLQLFSIPIHCFSQYPHPHHHHHTTITTQPLLPYLKCTWWRHDKNTLSASLAMCEGNCLIIKCQWCEEMLSCCYAEQKAEQAIELLPPIQDNITLMPRQYNSVYLQRYKINHYSNCVTLREYWDK